VLPKWEGDVVVQTHRPKQRAILKEHAEQLARLVELSFAAPDDVHAVDLTAAAVRLEQPDHQLQEDRLPGPRRPEHDRHFSAGQGQRNIMPDGLLSEGLRQALDDDFDTHGFPFLFRPQR
jgi:hypothetical protein